MNRTTLLILAALSLPAIAFAQTAVNSESEKAATKAEQDFSAALLKGDSATIDSMLAENAYTVTPDGKTATKSQFIADLKAGDLKFTQNQLSDMKVQVATADTAVVTYRSSDKGTYKGNDISGEYRWTDVLVKNGGKWQFIVGQGTAIASDDKK
ncbi:MAG: nuclear transport factor 2 family protein [Chthoniobacterales bacterium]